MNTVHTSTLPIATYSPLRVVLIGSGGNGSAVLLGLPWLHQAMLAWGGPATRGLEVFVIDGDVVSYTNCVRQPFGLADIGQNKATVLVHRVNLFHGVQWTAIPTYFGDPSIDWLPRKHSIDLVISCVDTRAARRAMHEEFTSRTGPWGSVRYWLDLGNGSDSGQYVLGQPRNRSNKASATRLRTVTELLPAIMTPDATEDTQPSCSAAEALDRQAPLLNNVLATSALSMLTRLIRHSELSYHGGFYNAVSGSSTPINVDPESWAKTTRRPKRTVRSTSPLAA